MVKTMTKFSVSVASALALFAANAQATEIETNTARLQAMNKLTGRVSVIDVPVNGEAQFGSFSIVVRACKTRPPEETPDNFAFLDVIDKQEDGAYSNIFKGWMISSSPALNAIEHPIYDVWLLQCINTDVDLSKLLSSEDLAARDEIVSVASTESETSASSAVSSNNSPEELLPAEAVQAPSVNVTESSENLAVSSENAAADTAEIQIKPMQEDSLPVKVDENIYETEEIYIPDENVAEGPQNLLPDMSVAAQSDIVQEGESPAETVEEQIVPDANEKTISPEELSQQVQDFIASEVKVDSQLQTPEDKMSDEPQQLITFEDTESEETLELPPSLQ